MRVLVTYGSKMGDWRDEGRLRRWAEGIHPEFSLGLL